MITKKVKRNDPCPCGSGKKYKHCCMSKVQAPRRARAIAARRLAEQQELTEEVAEDLVVYETTFDEIEAATQPMDVHRAEFEKMTKDPQAVAERARNLFAEARFEPFRYTAADVSRACQAIAYPEPPSRDAPGFAQFLNTAITYLADTKTRIRLGRELLMMLPDYVAQERYMDAWLIQFCAHHTVETPNEANPFLVEMFQYGLNEWRAEVVTQ
jgi:hypothetical protein